MEVLCHSGFASFAVSKIRPIYCCTFSQIDDVSQQLHETEDTLQKAMREAYQNMSARVSKLQDYRRPCPA